MLDKGQVSQLSEKIKAEWKKIGHENSNQN